MDTKNKMRRLKGPRLSAIFIFFISQSILFAAHKYKVHGSSTPAEARQAFSSLWELYKTISSKKFVDLTHVFNPGIPRWKAYPDEKVKTLYDYPKDGYLVELYTLVGQWGTHLDSPSHFHPDLRTIDQIPVNEMIAPLVVIDIADKCQSNPDTLLTPDDLNRWESKYGKIPERSFVAARTGWSDKWPSHEAILNRDSKGVMHYPGWSVEALKFLAEERNIVGIGFETMSADAGINVSAERYPAQVYIHGENRYLIADLANLDQVPEYGSLVIVAVPKPEKGSGFPARVFAILP